MSFRPYTLRWLLTPFGHYTSDGDGDDVDITSRVASCSISYGRSRPTDRFNAGRCSVVLHNRDAAVSPSDGGELGPAADIVGRLLTVDVTFQGDTDTTVLWQGFVDDVLLDYRGRYDARARLECVDILGLLGRERLAESYAVQTSGARISDIVTDVGHRWFTGRTDIDTGVVDVQADTVDTSLASYLRDVAAAEQDFVFCRFGTGGPVFRFVERNGWSIVPTLTLTDVRDADASDRPHVRSADVALTTDLLTNRAEWTAEGGVEQVHEDTASQDRFGRRVSSKSGLLNASDADVLALAQQTVSHNAEPRVLPTSVTVAMHDLTADQGSKVAGLSLLDPVTVELTPKGLDGLLGLATSSDALIDEDCLVEQVSHDISPDRWSVTFGLSSLTGQLSFILDDATYGVLDGVGVLGA